MALHPRWLATVMARYLAKNGMPTLAHYPQGAPSRMAPGTAPPKGAVPNLRGDNLTWDDVKRLREVWKGPLMIKGVHLPEDAARAVAEGLDAVIVSNHGGRNLDSAVAPIEVLPRDRGGSRRAHPRARSIGRAPGRGRGEGAGAGRERGAFGPADALRAVGGGRSGGVARALAPAARDRRHDGVHGMRKRRRHRSARRVDGAAAARLKLIVIRSRVL